MACMTEKDIALVHFVINRWWSYYKGNEDVFQECCLTLCDCARRLGDTFSENSSYVVKALNTTIVKHYRKEIKHARCLSYNTSIKNGEDDTNTDWIANLESPMMYPYDVDLPEYLNDTEKFIATRLAEGYTQQEIADILGVSRQRVCERKEAILKKLVRKRYVSKEEANERRRKRRRDAGEKGTGSVEQDV